MAKAKCEGSTGPKEDVKAFRRLLSDHPEQKLWVMVGGIMTHAETFTLQTGPLSPGLNEVQRRKQDEIREQLGFDDAPEMEKLLIAHVALCWLRLGLIEIAYSNVMHGQNSLKLCDFYDRHLSIAQKRFTRACETLERVRLLARSNPGLRLAGQMVA